MTPVYLWVALDSTHALRLFGKRIRHFSLYSLLFVYSLLCLFYFLLLKVDCFHDL